MTKKVKASRRGAKKKTGKRAVAKRKVAGRARSQSSRPAAKRKKSSRVPARVWVAVPDPAAPEGPAIEVAIPSRGRRTLVGERDVAEAAKQVSVLEEHGRISRSPDALGPGQTHVLEPATGGKRRLVRKRVSAI